ncbi:MAG: hypothetical protein GY759_23765 [Chloroflexi bacterium]|nr:hypothetical protein [Chloroflexota bacterium]
MKVLLLGVGMQGKAALHDLYGSDSVEQIIAADEAYDALAEYVRSKGYTAKVQSEPVDASDEVSVAKLMTHHQPDVVIDLLPTRFHADVAALAVAIGAHLVNASYVAPAIAALDVQASERDLAILPEFGLDPGIDLVLLGEAVHSLDTVEMIVTYGAGFPEKRAADNPINYKVSWTFEGVLKSYRRPGRVIRDGVVVDIGADEIFYAEHTHVLDVEDVGQFEAIANGDALLFADHLGIDSSMLQALGRYTLRWPGHCAFWKKMVDLHLLDDEPIVVDGALVDRKRFLAAVIEPNLQYGPDERDVVVVRVEVSGKKDGLPQQVVYQMIDKRDLVSGLSAMSRTVGFTASIGAQMIGTGAITKRGVLSPLSDVPYGLFVQELVKRGIRIACQRSEVEDRRTEK